MNGTEEASVDCPCCGEPITLIVDASLDEQRYVEDCPVCCRPMVVDVGRDLHDALIVTVSAEDEV